LEQKKEEIRLKQQQKEKQRAALMNAFKAKSRVSLMTDDFMQALSGKATESSEISAPITAPSPAV